MIRKLAAALSTVLMLHLALLSMLGTVDYARAQAINGPQTSVYGVPNFFAICGTDITSTLLPALASATTVSNGTVILPPCPSSAPLFYSSQVYIPNGVTLCGLGQGITWLEQANGANIGTTSATGQITNSGNTTASFTGNSTGTTSLVVSPGVVGTIIINSQLTGTGVGANVTIVSQTAFGTTGMPGKDGTYTTSANTTTSGTLTTAPTNGNQYNSNLTVCGLSVNGNQPNNTAAGNPGQCMTFLGVGNLTLNNLEITNCNGDAVNIDGNASQASPCDVRHLYIHDTLQAGLHLQHAQRLCITDDIKTVSTGSFGVFADASQGIFINLLVFNAGCAGGGTVDGACTSLRKVCSSTNALTNASAGPGTNIISYTTAVPAGIAIGQTVIDDANPTFLSPNTLITAVGASTITIAPPVPAGMTVNSGDRIRTYAAVSPGGGGAAQAGYAPCPAGIYFHNVTAKGCSNWFTMNNQYAGIVAIGVRFAACSNWISTNNSIYYPGNWDDVDLDLNNGPSGAFGYGETTGFSLAGLYVGADTQAAGDAQGMGAVLPAVPAYGSGAGVLGSSSPTSRWGLYIADGIAGGVASATIVTPGTGYPNGANGVQVNTNGPNQVCPVLPQFVVTTPGSGGVPSKVDFSKSAGVSGPGFCTNPPLNPVPTLSQGTGTGLTLNLTWDTMTLTGVTFGDTLCSTGQLTNCSGVTRLPAFTQGIRIQSSLGNLN